MCKWLITLSASNFSLSKFSHPLLVCLRIDSVCSFEAAAVASGIARSAKCLMHYITGISQPFLTTCELFPHVRHVRYLVFNYTTLGINKKDLMKTWSWSASNSSKLEGAVHNIWVKVCVEVSLCTNKHSVQIPRTNKHTKKQTNKHCTNKHSVQIPRTFSSMERARGVTYAQVSLRFWFIFKVIK